MKEKKFSIGVTDVALLILGAVFLVGVLTVFRPCAAMDDGSWMTCHWAGRAATGVAGAMLVLAAIHLIGGAKFRTGLDIALIVLSALAVCIPGRLIGLCMMPDMRCRRIMTPCVIVLSILTAAVAVIDMLLQNIKEKKAAKEQKKE